MSDETEDTDHSSAVADSRRRWLRFGLFGAIVGVSAALIVPAVPRDQSVRLHLGPGSTKVVRAVARVSHDVSSGWERETTWRFDQGAPPSVVWKFESPNGHAEVEVELASAAAISSQRTKVELRGDETTVELADAMRGLP